MANVHGMPTNTIFGKGENTEEKEDSEVISMSKEQYQNVMTMLHNFQVNAGENANNSSVGNGFVSFAGTVVCTSSIDFGKPSCRYFESKSDLWILDSVASNYMTFHRPSMSNVKTLPYLILISLPNGYKVKVTELGDVTLTPKLTLHKVLYVPSFKFNLVSIYSLTTYLKGIALFTDTSCLLQAPSMKRPQEIGEYRDGLYFLCSRCLKGRSATSTTNSYMSCNSVTNSQASVLHSSHSFHSQPDVHNSISNNKNEHPIYVLIPHSSHRNNIDLLWHNRLGHVPFAKMRTLTSIPVTFLTKQPFVCSICPMSRQSRLSFSQRTTESSKIFDLLHVDLRGPYHVSTHDN